MVTDSILTLSTCHALEIWQSNIKHAYVVHYLNISIKVRKDKCKIYIHLTNGIILVIQKGYHDTC